MRMGDNKITFQPVPETTHNVRILGSLVFDKRSELGHRALIDLTDISSHLLLARDCIAALYEHSSPDIIASDYSIGSYSKSIRDFLDYCQYKAVPDDFRMIDVTFEFLLDYRAHLRLSCSEFKTENRRRHFGNLLRLLQAGQTVGLAHPDLMPPCNFIIVDDSDRTLPYTAGEALDFEDTCRTHIREILARIEKGKKLLKMGKNPKGIKRISRDTATGRIIKQADCDRPWTQLPNLLWYVVHVLEGKYFRQHDLLKGGHATFQRCTNGTYGGAYSKKYVYSHLYPLTEDLIPFIVLLAKKTGRNQSSIFSLKRNCVTEVEERYFLWYEKARGSARLYKKAIDDNDQFSPVYLIKTLLQITEPLVQLAAPQDREKLFLGLSIGGHGNESAKCPYDCYMHYLMNRIGGWCDQRELRDEHERPLRVSHRRLRVTYLTNRYKKTGQLSKVSSDAAHTLGKTSVGYVDNESTKHLHEKAVEAGIQRLRSLARPKVLVQVTPQAAAKVIGTDEATAKLILNGKQDVFFATCKDFYNRPGGQPNTPCDKPWGCFFCANAIITRHVLPRVMAFRNYILEERDKLTTDDWNAKYGKVWHLLTCDVFPKFSPDIISEAELLARDEVFYIPINMKA